VAPRSAGRSQAGAPWLAGRATDNGVACPGEREIRERLTHQHPCARKLVCACDQGSYPAATDGAGHHSDIVQARVASRFPRAAQPITTYGQGCYKGTAWMAGARDREVCMSVAARTRAGQRRRADRGRQPVPRRRGRPETVRTAELIASDPGRQGAPIRVPVEPPEAADRATEAADGRRHARLP
jgi:hypothetical protein